MVYLHKNLCPKCNTLTLYSDNNEDDNVKCSVCKRVFYLPIIKEVLL